MHLKHKQLFPFVQINLASPILYPHISEARPSRSAREIPLDVKSSDEAQAQVAAGPNSGNLDYGIVVGVDSLDDVGNDDVGSLVPAPSRGFLGSPRDRCWDELLCDDVGGSDGTDEDGYEHVFESGFGLALFVVFRPVGL